MKLPPRKVRLHSDGGQAQIDGPGPVVLLKATTRSHVQDCLVPGCGRKGDVAHPVWIGQTGVLKGYYCVAHQHLVHGYRQLRGNARLMPDK